MASLQTLDSKMCYDAKDRVKHARHSLGLCTMGKNCVGQRSLFTLGVYLNVYLKHLRLMSGRGGEGSASSFPATFNRVFQLGKQSPCYCRILGGIQNNSVHTVVCFT